MRLSSAEYEIMQVIWGKEGPASGSDLEPLSRQRGWKAPTVATFLKRLCEKGVLTSYKEGGRRLYRPALSREEFAGRQARTFVEEWYGGHVSDLVAGLSGQGALTDQEKERLKKLLEGEFR